MRILGPFTNRWRWEYQLDESRRRDYCCPRKWRLFLEGVRESTTPERFDEMSELMPSGHPSRLIAESIFSTTHDKVESILPWRPFEPCPELLAALGPDVVARMQAKDRECKVWSSVDGWTWMHLPGDSAVAP